MVDIDVVLISKNVKAEYAWGTTPNLDNNNSEILYAINY